MAEYSEDVQKWMKRLNRKGPFYLYKEDVYKPYTSAKEPVKHYFVIWNDKEKTKYGYFYDGMHCRYGVQTCTVLNGNTKFDLWAGHNIDDDIFEAMLKLRNETSELRHFELTEIQDLRW